MQTQSWSRCLTKTNLRQAKKNKKNNIALNFKQTLVSAGSSPLDCFPSKMTALSNPRDASLCLLRAQMLQHTVNMKACSWNQMIERRVGIQSRFFYMLTVSKSCSNVLIIINDRWSSLTFVLLQRVGHRPLWNCDVVIAQTSRTELMKHRVCLRLFLVCKCEN